MSTMKKEKKDEKIKELDEQLIKIFGTNVKALRKSKRPKLTSEKLAEKAGISYGWVSEIENFHAVGVSLAIAYRIAKALDTSLDSLLEEEIDIERTLEQLRGMVTLRQQTKRSA